MLVIKKIIKYAELPNDSKKEKLGSLIKKYTTSSGILQTVLLYKAIERLGGWREPSSESDCIGFEPFEILYGVYIKDQVDASMGVHSDMGDLHLAIVES